MPNFIYIYIYMYRASQLHCKNVKVSSIASVQRFLKMYNCICSEVSKGHENTSCIMWATLNRYTT